MTEQQALFVALVILAVAVAVLVLTWSLLRAGQHPAPAMLVLSVSILSMTALIGGLIFRLRLGARPRQRRTGRTGRGGVVDVHHAAATPGRQGALTCP